MNPVQFLRIKSVAVDFIAIKWISILDQNAEQDDGLFCTAKLPKRVKRKQVELSRTEWKQIETNRTKWSQMESNGTKRKQVEAKTKRNQKPNRSKKQKMNEQQYITGVSNHSKAIGKSRHFPIYLTSQMPSITPNCMRRSVEHCSDSELRITAPGVMIAVWNSL